MVGGGVAVTGTKGRSFVSIIYFANVMAGAEQGAGAGAAPVLPAGGATLLTCAVLHCSAQVPHENCKKKKVHRTRSVRNCRNGNKVL